MRYHELLWLLDDTFAKYRKEECSPEEIKLVKNIIKQIKTNERTKGFSWDYDNW